MRVRARHRGSGPGPQSRVEPAQPRGRRLLGDELGVDGGGGDDVQAEQGG